MLIKCGFFLYFLIGWTSASLAADLIEILPVTDKILSVFLKDGHIDSYGIGQQPANNITYHNPVDIKKVYELSNYEIISPDDRAFLTPKNPVAIGRKSKAVDYNDEWQTIPFVWGHTIYLELPNSLIQGKTYTVRLKNLVENTDSIKFVYDIKNIRSPAIHVNMIGFVRNSPKYAYISHWMGDFNTPKHQDGGLELDERTGAAFHVVRFSDKQICYSGVITKRLDKLNKETASSDFAPQHNYTHADVWQCDFTAFTDTGEYVIAVEGIGCSYPFHINDDVTREPFYYAMKGLFWQRQGIVKEIEPGKTIPRDHHPDDIVWKWDKNWIGGEDVSGFNTNVPSVKGIWGHYFDAGDWDHYVHHAKVPMLLLLLYDLAPERFFDADVGNRYKLNDKADWIDEGTNGIPDLLDEAAWLINFFRRARTVLKTNHGGTGGVPGYVGRDAIDGNNYTAWMDKREWYISAENVEATFLYSGLAAWYAECLNKMNNLKQKGKHPEYDAWMSEALEAWNWANQKGASSDNERRAMGFAAVCLFRSTSQKSYQDTFYNYFNWEPSKNDGEWSNPNIIDISSSIFSLIPSTHANLNKTLQTLCINLILNKVDELKVKAIESNGMRCPMEHHQFFLLGAFSTPKMTLVPVAHKLTGLNKYLDALYNAASYVLGGNQLNMTFLSGLGEESDVWIFNPNGWLFYDYNSMVYSNKPFIGYTSYFGAVNYWFTQSVFSEYFSRTGAYPQAKDSPNTWPESESKFYNRYSIQGGEFTIHQQNCYMIYVMGYLKAISNSSSEKYIPNTRPSVSLNLEENSEFPLNGGFLSVKASDDTRKVCYYYDWHYIGESINKADNFKFFWKPKLNDKTKVLITAVGFDDRGLMTEPSDDADKSVTISSAVSVRAISSANSFNSASAPITFYSLNGMRLISYKTSIIQPRFKNLSGIVISKSNKRTHKMIMVLKK